MIIRTMKATFGTLAGDELKLDRGLNIIYAPNESGKSTWCAFLRAMLYGVDTAERARGGQLPAKTKYAPWSGAPMEGEITLEHEGRSITLRRTTPNEKAPMRDFTAVYTGTNEPVPGITAATVGQTLTGVSAPVFARTAFIGQGSVTVTGTPELERRIASMVTAGEETTSFTEAEGKLRAWQRKRQNVSRGEIPAVDQKIAAIEQKLETVAQSGQKQALLQRELEENEAEIARLTKGMNEARARQRREALSQMGQEKASLQHVEDELAAARRDAAQKRTALEQTRFGVTDPDDVAETLERDAESAREQLRASKRTGKPYFWIAAILLAALCAVLGYLVNPLLYYAAVACALAAAGLAVWQLVQNRRAAAAHQAFLAILQDYDAKSINDMFRLADEHRAAYRACRAAMQTERELSAQAEDAREHQAETHERLLRRLDFEHGDSEAATYFRQKQALERVTERLRAQQSELAGAVRAIGDPMALESELETLRTRRDELQDQYDAIALAIDALKEADGEIQTRFSPELAAKAADYMDYLTQGRYDGVALTRDFAASAKRADDLLPRSASYLSAGAADLLYLSVRLAMCAMTLTGDDPCPIILDDTLVNFDDARAKRAMELFYEISRERQVILFTCHKRDYPDAVVDANII